MNKEKKLHLELLRIFAIILVIFIHTGERGINLFLVRKDSIFYLLYLFCAIVPRGIAVPLFWMISGSLLIPKTETIGTTYKKRVSKMALALVVFLLIQYLLSLDNMADFSLKSFLRRVYVGDLGSAWAYWYIYSYLGMLMILPLLRKLARAMTVQEWLYFFGVFLILFGVIPSAEYLFSGGDIRIRASLTTNTFSRHIVFFITGHYIENVIPEKKLSNSKARLLLLMGLISSLTACLVIQHMINISDSFNSSMLDNISESIYMISMFIPAFAIFYFARTFFVQYEGKIGHKMRAALTTAGSASFGVMLLENIWREKLLFIYEALRPFCRSLPSCVIWVLCVWVCGMVTALVLKKIPGIKRLL